jgi:hypothetical protein
MERNRQKNSRRNSGSTIQPVWKICQSCGRRMEWRSAWARDWDNVRYCSKSCRKNKLGPLDVALEDAIILLLKQRARSATICPSEAARLVESEDWRSLMERTRRAARRLVGQGRLEILQGGRVVDPSTARGPIRLRLIEQELRASG